MKRWSPPFRVLVSIGFALLLAAAPAAALEVSGLLEIHVVNVQQGAAALVIGPDGTTVLMDAGGNGKGRGEVVPYLEEIGLLPADGLDYTLMSHLHADHIGGFDEVIEAGYDVRGANWYNAEVELPLPDGTPATIESYFAAAALTAAGGPTPIPLGHRLELGAGATLTVVATGGEVAGYGFVDGAERDENDLSVAVSIRHGAFDFVWAGDVGGGDDDRECTGRSTDQVNVETPLARALRDGGHLTGDVEVLHVNHHGSQSSTNSDYVNLLRPRVAVISVDAHKGFGHPHAVVVDNVLLGRAPCVVAPPALVLQTDEGHPEGEGTSFSGHVVGDVRIVTDGDGSFRVEAGGDVRHGTPERVAAGLPKEFCLAGDTTLCLGDGRFRVTVDWRTPQGRTGPGRAMPLTADTGYFWFFRPDNVEMLLKVLDACVDPFNHFWVFAGGLTDVHVEITVTDVETGATRTYVNPLGTQFQPIQDTRAFSCDDNLPPEAAFVTSCVGLACDFEDRSVDPDGTIVDRRWDFGDGMTAGGPSVGHRYAVGGSYDVTLTVEDDRGATATATEIVTVSDSPTTAAVVLSEVFYNAEGGDDELEWVELYNPGAATVDLGGWSLGNGGDDYTRSKVQLAGTIAPGATFVVGGPTSAPANGSPVFDQVFDFDPDFQNSGDQGDGVALFDRPAAQVTASTVPVDAVVYGPNNDGGLIDETGVANAPEVGNAPAGSSIERLDLAGAWQIQPTPTPNEAQIE